MPKMNDSLSQLQLIAYMDAHEKGWAVYWDRNECNKEKGFTVGEALCLIAGEASGEAMEAFRDDNKGQFAEELADVVIRCLHLAGELKIDLVQEINKKLTKNRTR